MSNTLNMISTAELGMENDSKSKMSNKIMSRSVEICKVKYKCFLLICTLISLCIVNVFQIIKENMDDTMKHILLSVLKTQNNTMK